MELDGAGWSWVVEVSARFSNTHTFIVVEL